MTCWQKTYKIIIERKAELREWVIKNCSYGGAGAINGPVFKTREGGIQHCMIKRAFDLAVDEEII